MCGMCGMCEITGLRDYETTGLRDCGTTGYPKKHRHSQSFSVVLNDFSSSRRLVVSQKKTARPLRAEL